MSLFPCLTSFDKKNFNAQLPVIQQKILHYERQGIRVIGIQEIILKVNEAAIGVFLLANILSYHSPSLALPLWGRISAIIALNETQFALSNSIEKKKRNAAFFRELNFLLAKPSSEPLCKPGPLLCSRYRRQEELDRIYFIPSKKYRSDALLENNKDEKKGLSVREVERIVSKYDLAGCCQIEMARRAVNGCDAAPSVPWDRVKASLKRANESLMQGRLKDYRDAISNLPLSQDMFLSSSVDFPVTEEACSSEAAHVKDKLRYLHRCFEKVHEIVDQKFKEIDERRKVEFKDAFFEPLIEQECQINQNLQKIDAVFKKTEELQAKRRDASQRHFLRELKKENIGELMAQARLMIRKYEAETLRKLEAHPLIRIEAKKKELEALAQDCSVSQIAEVVAISQSILGLLEQKLENQEEKEAVIESLIQFEQVFLPAIKKKIQEHPLKRIERLEEKLRALADEPFSDLLGVRLKEASLKLNDLRKEISSQIKKSQDNKPAQDLGALFSAMETCLKNEEVGKEASQKLADFEKKTFLPLANQIRSGNVSEEEISSPTLDQPLQDRHCSELRIEKKIVHLERPLLFALHLQKKEVRNVAIAVICSVSHYFSISPYVSYVLIHALTKVAKSYSQFLAAERKKLRVEKWIRIKGKIDKVPGNCSQLAYLKERSNGLGLDGIESLASQFLLKQDAPFRGLKKSDALSERINHHIKNWLIWRKRYQEVPGSRPIVLKKEEIEDLLNQQPKQNSENGGVKPRTLVEEVPKQDSLNNLENKAERIDQQANDYREKIRSLRNKISTLNEIGEKRTEDINKKIQDLEKKETMLKQLIASNALRVLREKKIELPDSAFSFLSMRKIFLRGLDVFGDQGPSEKDKGRLDSRLWEAFNAIYTQSDPYEEGAREQIKTYIDKPLSSAGTFSPVQLLACRKEIKQMLLDLKEDSAFLASQKSQCQKRIHEYELAIKEFSLQREAKHAEFFLCSMQFRTEFFKPEIPKPD